MSTAVNHRGVIAARVVLGAGLLASATFVVAIGGWWATVIAAGQAAAALGLFGRPRSRAPLAAATLTLVPAPLSAAHHWTARLPGACKCARLPYPPPGLLSLTGGVVALDVALLALTVWLVAKSRSADSETELGKL